MIVVGRQRIDEFRSRYSDAAGQLNAWLAEVSEATWATPQDIKNRYASASFLAENTVVFNIKGGRYRLVVAVAYQTGTVVIKRVGTHAEYDRWTLP